MTFKKVFQLALFLACGHSFSQLGVGTSLPNPSAQLEIVSNDKGVLIPRLALTSLTDATTIANGNVESLMVYNTNSAGNLSPGYYYWGNAKWNKLATISDTATLTVDDNLISNSATNALSANQGRVLKALVDVNTAKTGITENQADDITANKSGVASNLTALGAKADAVDVLQLDNTTAFTPDADYEPATKKYVDDNETTVTVTDNLTSNSTTEALSANQGRALEAAKASKANVLELDNTTAFTPDADYEPATKKYVDDNETTLTVTDNLTSTSTTEALSANQGRALEAAKAAKTNVLELDNTTAFTPDADYEPATKKYVDDNETSVTITDNLTSNSTTEALSANQGRVLDENKLNNTIADGSIFIGNGSGVAMAQNMAGDATITNAGVVTISDNAINGENIALGSDTEGDVMYYNGTDWVSLATGTAGQKLVVNSTATAPEWATETASSLTDLTDVNTAAVTAGNLLVANGTDFESVAMSGDATITDTGVMTLSENAVDGTKIQVTGEAEGSMLYNNGMDWVDFPKGTSGQYLKMNAAGTAPEWVTETKVASKRIGEFVYAKSGRTVSDGYLAVTPGAVTNGAVDYPVWAAQYSEFVSGNDIIFPSSVAGMFLRNSGGNAATEGNFQDDATARPNSNFTTNTSGDHRHYIYGDTASEVKGAGSSTDYVLQNADGANDGEYTSTTGDHSHSVTGGGDAETRPRNRAYQLYTIVDTY